MHLTALVGYPPLSRVSAPADTINTQCKTSSSLLSTGSNSATMLWLNFGTVRWKDESRGESWGGGRGHSYPKGSGEIDMVAMYGKGKESKIKKSGRILTRRKLRSWRIVFSPRFCLSMCVRCDNGDDKRRRMITRKSWQGRRRDMGITYGDLPTSAPLWIRSKWMEWRRWEAFVS